MKRIFAFILAVVMAFSMTVVAVAAESAAAKKADISFGNAEEDVKDVVDSAEDIRDSLENKDIDGVLDNSFNFAEALIKAIHTLVHTLSEIFDFDCPFCDGSEIVDEPTTEEPSEETTTEEPSTEETTTEEPSTEETTTEEPSTEETTTEEPSTEETTTEEPSTEETTTEEPSTEETTTEEPSTEETTTEEPSTEETTTEEPTTEAPVVTYETYYTQIKNSTLANDRNYNYAANGAYPMNVDVYLYFWNRNYKANTVTITGTATAYVNAAVYISEESVGINKIVFGGGNNFHGNNGVFKLIVNTTDNPVKVELKGTNKIGSTVLTAENVGNYIVGPYTLV